MTKQELLENYTMEQLADMVIKLESDLRTARNLQNEVLFEQRIAENIRSVTGMNIDEVRKTLQNTKEYMNNTYVKKLKDEIDSLKDRLQHKEAAINQIDDILKDLFGVTHGTDKKPEELKKILEIFINEVANPIYELIPTEPIKLADFLISAEGEYERNTIEKAFYGNDKGTYNLFDVTELRQIAEHLLVYCNANGEGEE